MNLEESRALVPDAFDIALCTPSFPEATNFLRDAFFD